MKNPSTDEGTAIAQTELVATTRSSSSAKPTAPKTWAVTEGKLEIDIRGEGIESTIKNARFDPNGEVTLDDGTYFSGNIESGRVTVDGTLIVGVGASVTATKVQCKRLYVNAGSLKCESVQADVIVGWEGVIEASDTISYKSLEQTGLCEIQGRLVRIRD